MVFRKHNSTAGFSLIEVLVAITILGFVVVPIGSSLVLSFRLNARSEDMLQAQLAVSSAVETIMAEGVDGTLSPEDYEDRFGMQISVTEVNEELTFEREFTIEEETAEGAEQEGTEQEETEQEGTEDIVINYTYYKITVSDNAGLVSVDTYARPKGGAP